MKPRYSKQVVPGELLISHAPMTKDEIAQAKAFLDRMVGEGRITFGRVSPPTTILEPKVTAKQIEGWEVGREYEIPSPHPRRTQIRISTAARRKGVRLKTSVRGNSIVCQRLE